MIFKNAQVIPADEMVRNLLKSVKSSIHAHRMTEREQFLDRYTGKNITVKIKEKNYFAVETLKIVAIAEHNIVKRVVNRESMVYKDMPNTIFGDGKEQPKLPPEYDLTERWMAFKKAERMANLLGTVLIHPIWRADRLQWDIIHDYEILTVNDPFTPVAIRYPLNMHVASSQEVEKEWVYWDAQRHFIIDANGNRKKPADDNDKMLNPYGVLPFITVSPDEQIDEYWVESPQVDIVNAMDALNKGVTEGRLAVRYAAGQRVITGDHQKDDLQTGLEFILKLTEAATYTHEATDSNFPGMIEMIKFDIETAFSNHGMSAEFTENSAPASGFSLMIKNLPLLENREDDAARWKWADQQVYGVEQAIMKVKSKELPKERRVDYSEITFPLSPDEQQKQDDWDLSHGAITMAQILRRRDPDGYDDEAAAQKVIDENLETNKTLKVRATDEPQSQPGIFESRGNQ